jgi:hypothetical protein
MHLHVDPEELQAFKAEKAIDLTEHDSGLGKQTTWSDHITVLAEMADIKF